MSHDYFLYTCLEEQRTLDSVFKKNLGKIHSYRWPMMPEQKLQAAEDLARAAEATAKANKRLADLAQREAGLEWMFKGLKSLNGQCNIMMGNC